MTRDKEPANDLWQRAASFVARGHQGQFRGDDKTPYAAHPFRVAMTVGQVFEVNDPTLLAAALLHDLIEDTPADYDEVAEEFGTEVADIVAYLTKDMRLPEPDREEEYDRRLAEAPWQVRLIKLADVFDNLSDTETTKKPVKKAIEKAQRAIALAENDPQLKSAVAAVKALIKKKTNAKH